jgi:D-alanyl-D-alanine carboxypeptidase
MFDAAEEEGLYMIVREGYRTQEDQQKLMNEKVEEYQEKVRMKFVARWYAEKWVAVPGTSEHQLGIAVDINADGVHSSGSEVYTWLEEHAHEYGFIQRYPEDKTEITGINYEPWHYRYVGKEHAEKIMAEGMCLEEYIEQLGGETRDSNDSEE